MKNFYTYCIYGMNNGNFSFPILFFIYLFFIFRAVRIFPKKEYCFNYLVIFASRTTDF